MECEDCVLCGTDCMVSAMSLDLVGEGDSNRSDMPEGLCCLILRISHSRKIPGLKLKYFIMISFRILYLLTILGLCPITMDAMYVVLLKIVFKIMESFIVMLEVWR
jgi:hypothetical protein